MDIENSKGTHWPIATVSLGVLNIAVMVFVICKFNTIEPDPQTLVSVGGNIRSLTFGGQFWRLIISAFLHVDIQHILFNVISLFSIGVPVIATLNGVTIAFIAFDWAVEGFLIF